MSALRCPLLARMEGGLHEKIIHYCYSGYANGVHLD